MSPLPSHRRLRKRKQSYIDPPGINRAQRVERLAVPGLRRELQVVASGLQEARLVICHIEPTTIHDRELAVSLFARGMTLARQTGNRTLEIQLLRTKMVDAAHYGPDQDAYEAGEAAISAARAESSFIQLATVLNDYATHLRLSGQQPLAQGYAEEARALFRSQNNLPLLADNLAQQAWSDLHQMKFNSALSMADQSIELCHEINNNWNLCLAYQTKAQVKAAIGDWGDAILLFEQAIAFGQESDLALARVMPTNLLGDLLRTIGHIERAEALHRAAHAIAEKDVPFLVHALEAQLAMNAYARNRIAAGDQWLDAARDHQPVGAIGRAWCTLPDIARAAVMSAEKNARWQDAANLTQAALDEAQERALPLHIPPLLLAQSRCRIARDQFQAAETVLEEAADMTTSPILHPIWWQIHQLRAQLRRQQNRVAEAQQHDRLALAERSRLATSLGDSELVSTLLAA
ncbi:MAG: hypothetical protein H6644_18565 [Caldilineaceae bacterium]|nr:hypothetical protein [Caldilineaceae bacterium]